MSARLMLAVTLCSAALSGCNSGPALVETPIAVEVPGPVQYVPLPPEATADCPQKPAPVTTGMTGGELASAAKGWEARARCRDDQLVAIRRLQAVMPPERTER